MRLNTLSRTRLLVDMTTDTDPTGSTLELLIDGVWYPCEWLDTPRESGDRWYQTGRTQAWFSGTAQASTTVLLPGTYATTTRVTWPGGDRLAENSSSVTVVG